MVADGFDIIDDRAEAFFQGGHEAVGLLGDPPDLIRASLLQAAGEIALLRRHQTVLPFGGAGVETEEVETRGDQ